MNGSPIDTSQLLKGVLDLAVLAVLAEQDSYGYDILRRLRESAVKPTTGRIRGVRL